MVRRPPARSTAFGWVPRAQFVGIVAGGIGHGAGGRFGKLLWAFAAAEEVQYQVEVYLLLMG